MPHHTPRKFTHKEMIEPQYEEVVDVVARAQNTAFEYRELEMFEAPLSLTMVWPFGGRLEESCERISPCHIP